MKLFIDKWGETRYFALYDEDRIGDLPWGGLICVTVYKTGAKNVKRLLEEQMPPKAQIRIDAYIRLFEFCLDRNLNEDEKNEVEDFLKDYGDPTPIESDQKLIVLFKKFFLTPQVVTKKKHTRLIRAATKEKKG